MTTKDSRQPSFAMTQDTSGIASAEPTREPLSKILLAKLRSLRGNHEAATLAKDG